MTDIGRWLEERGLGKYTDVFVENGVDLDVVSQLSEEDLKDLGLNLGDRRRFQAALQNPPSADSAELEELTTALPFTPVREAERRQLTVMFCDLVGSVELGERMDVEDYRDLLSRFRNTIVEAVEHYGGFVARHQGDGVLTYFGYPQAHENDAERAVLAGLDAVRRIVELEHPCPAVLRVRAGIATGLAVVGDALSTGSVEELAAFGPTPNLSARLQGLAEPNSLLISETTYRLTQDRFVVQPVSNVEVKGHDEPITAYRALGLAESSPDQDRTSINRLTPLLGRTSERDLLFQRWSQACAGEGQIVLLCGEPGVGKTRLLQELDRQVREESANRIPLFCSTFQQNTALYPARRQLERALGLKPEHSATTKRSMLRQMLASFDVDVGRHEPLLSRLLSLTADEEEQASGFTAEQVRARTLEALVDMTQAMARQRPTLLVVEDLHWIDPTTQAFLDELLAQIATWQLLVVLTFRPEFEVPWVRHPQATFLTLQYLGQKDCGALVRQIAGTHDLPERMVEDIIARTDGVPLFVEELTKTVIESNIVGFSETMDIPATLQDSLMARLDRLGPAKRVAQMGAVIGREFQHELLRVISEEPSDLDTALVSLESSELVQRRGAPPDASYRFKHALVQDAAYQSLLSSTRRELHLRIAQVLEPSGELARLGDSELLAIHYERGGNIERAVDFRHAAGERSVRSHSLREAEHHFKSGLEQLGHLTATPESTVRRAELTLALGAVQMPLYGFGSDVVRETYSQARRLAADLGDPSRKFDAAWGLWLNRNVSGDLKTAQDLNDEIDSLASGMTDPGYALQAHHAGFTTLYITGELEATRKRTSALLELYSPQDHKEHAFRYGGHDPAVCGHGHGALSSWLLGYPDRALRLWKAGMELAESLEHPASIGVSKNFGSMLFQFLREPEQVKTLSVPAPGAPAHFQSMMLTAHGWALAQQGSVEEGLRECQRGVQGYQGTGARARLSYLQYLLADVLYLAERPEDALAEVETAIDHAVDKATLADLYRLKGDALRTHSTPNVSSAERALSEALTMARRQRAKSWEIRSSTSLAQLYAAEGRPEKARDVLTPIYNAFTEGLGTPDLLDARTILDELS